MSPSSSSDRNVHPWVSAMFTLAVTLGGCDGGWQAEGPAPAAAGTAGSSGSGGTGGGPTECEALDPIPSRLWRLSTAQFSNSVRDLLGLATGPLVADTGGSAEYAFFSDTAAGVNDTLAFSLYEAVQAALEQVRPRIPALAACLPSEAEDECADRFARTFATRAFRRPLEESEVTALLAVYAEGRKTSFETGIESMIEALLQAPSFLYRSELGEPDGTDRVLTPHETATQLAYFFLDTTPDARLMAAAGDGRLATPEGIAAEIDRLLATSAVRKNIDRIVLDWFGVRQALSKTNKSAVLFAALAETDRDQVAIVQELLTATELFIDEILWRSGNPVNELLTSPRVFANRRLSTLYGIPFSGPPATFVGADFPTEQQRAGILTQPSVLWAVSDPETTSIVHRGLYVHDDILCLPAVPSPGDLLQQPDIQAALAMLPTERDKSNYRMHVNTECLGCHIQIDPYALILENFDPIGAYRTEADGVTVEPTGEFELSPSLTGPISGAQSFARGATTDGLFTACASQKILSYAIGREIHAQETCEVRDVHARFLAGGGTIQSLFREVALSNALQNRAGEAL